MKNKTKLIFFYWVSFFAFEANAIDSAASCNLYERLAESTSDDYLTNPDLGKPFFENAKILYNNSEILRNSAYCIYSPNLKYKVDAEIFHQLDVVSDSYLVQLIAKRYEIEINKLALSERVMLMHHFLKSYSDSLILTLSNAGIYNSRIPLDAALAFHSITKNRFTPFVHQPLLGKDITVSKVEYLSIINEKAPKHIHQLSAYIFSGVIKNKGQE